MPSRHRTLTEANAVTDQPNPADRDARPIAPPDPSSMNRDDGRPPTTTRTEFPIDRQANRAGVFQSPDAPDGYVVLVVKSTRGRRILRIEIAQDFYSHAWVEWLERWLAKWDRFLFRVK